MRVATTTIFQLGTTNMSRHTADQAKLQSQLSTGRRILTPADDPIASARLLDIAQSQSLNEQYNVNSKTADSSLSMTEELLQQVTTVIQNVQTLAVNAGNGSQTAADKRILASELRGHYQQLLELANSTDGGGLYLFSGFAGDTKPFTEASFGNVTYNGDDGQRQVQVSTSRNIPVSESGNDVFMRIKNGNGTFVTAAAATNVGTGVVSPGEVLDPVAWSNAPAPRDFQVQFYWANNPAKPTEPLMTYDLIDNTTGNSLITGNATAGNTTGPRAWTPGSDIQFKQLPTDPVPQPAAWDYGIKMSVKGTPVAVDPTTKLPVGLPGVADSFSVKPSTDVDVFTTLGNMINALESFASDGSGAGQAAFMNKLNTGMLSLANSLQNVLTTQANIGSRMNETESIRSTNSDINLQYAKTSNDLGGIDWAKTISDFAENQMVLDAARKSFSQVQGLSLFKYI
ncbi:flagellar hook-associated protein FlgL [Chitinilyticum piscinae]|uniref:Flagellar hook-associated protein FlgL n=1 Tax=Chitinilyticum piscinae TaxID=2866724 RepID=A0A8J7K318_9NEIS|nr:flagellar hook-associated protein FlgL [Chitinilyticum piscinae]MBE9610762.1 flagellar hook-associated protein FlgL [Chitinilyticum piscinae]